MDTSPREEPSLSDARRLRASRLCGLIAAALGATTLVGGASGNPVLGAVAPGLQPMRMSAALAFVLGGAALWMLAREPSPVGSRESRGLLVRFAGVVMAVLAAVALLMATLALAALLYGFDPDVFARFSVSGTAAAAILASGIVLAVMDRASRVRSIAVLHDRAFRTADVARLDVRRYLESVALDTDRALGSGASSIEVEMDEDLRELSMDLVMPAGLVVGELVSNAVQHAGKADGSAPRIEVGLRREGGETLLSVEHDGRGFLTDAEAVLTGSLGMTLVSALARQLGGDVSIGRSRALGGARVSVSVGEPEGKA